MKYKSKKYIIIKEDGSRFWTCEDPDLWTISQGYTPEEALKNCKLSVETTIEDMSEEEIEKYVKSVKKWRTTKQT